MENSVDSNWFENWFTVTDESTKQQTLWGKLINSTGTVIDSLPNALDGFLESKFQQEVQKETSTNENITSSNPAVSANANQSVFSKPTVQYGLIGAATILVGVVVYKAIR